MCACACVCALWGLMCQVLKFRCPPPPKTSCSFAAQSAGLVLPHQSIVLPMVLQDATGRMTLLENVRGWGDGSWGNPLPAAITLEIVITLFTEQRLCSVVYMYHIHWSSQQRREVTCLEGPVFQFVTKTTLGYWPEPQSCHLWNGNSIYLMELWRLNKTK